jgi:hypothetical protein
MDSIIYRNADSHDNRHIYTHRYPDNYINSHEFIHINIYRYINNYRNIQPDIQCYRDLDSNTLLHQHGFADGDPELYNYRILHSHTLAYADFYLYDYSQSHMLNDKYTNIHGNPVFHNYDNHAADPDRHMYQNGFLL